MRQQPAAGFFLLSTDMNEKKARIQDKSIPPFDRLLLLMELLRSPQGCAWDRRQTHQSLLPYLIEETYELVDAIESDNPAGLREELGDLLCQIVFHAQLARERGDFELNDSVEDLINKLVHRHPHVFGHRNNLQPHEVRDQWERIKAESGDEKSALSGLPGSMPALIMAFRVGEKAGGLGFDWNKAADVLEKIDEEIDELKAEIFSHSAPDKGRIENELGDLLFAIVSLARKLEINPELALKRALQKFRTRFDLLESRLRQNGEKFSDYSLAQLESIWQEIKKQQ